MMDKIIEEIEKIISKIPNQTYYSEVEINSLLLELEKDNRFDIFKNHCHRLGTSRHCFNRPTEFPNQIIQRAKETSAQNVITEIQRYLDDDEVQTEYGLLLYSTHLDNEFIFSNGVKLLNISSLTDSNLISFLNKESISTGGTNTAIMVVDYVTPKKYYSSIASDASTTDWSHVELKSELIKKIDDTRLMLSLARNHSYGISVVASFDIIPDSLSFLNGGISYGPYPEPRTSISPEILDLELHRADQLLVKFEALSTVDKERIRIALKRLNDAKIDSNWANKSINLRICLENLFYDNSEYGIAQTISERAPKHTNFTKTKARNVYNFLSTAVHTGNPPEHETINEGDITLEIHKTIIQFIENGGYPTWPKKKKQNKFQKLFYCIKKIFK